MTLHESQRGKVQQIDRLAGEVLHYQHGMKMDGPRNNVERGLLQIHAIATALLNEDEAELRRLLFPE